jgi:4-hydroxythreonine-4-phosphate dehydrogenase
MTPLIGITLGDPSGIGPEVIAAAWREPAVHAVCRPFVVGHPEFLRRAAQLWELPLRVEEIENPSEARPSTQCLPCLPVGSDNVLYVAPGTIDARCGQAAYAAIVRAAGLAISGQIDALVTAPINKAALWEAGYQYPGHTELLAQMCGVQQYAMMLYLGPDGAALRGASGLGVVHVTLHMALRDAVQRLTCEAIVEKCHLAHDVMSLLKGSPPRIGVCALNPHAGEHGLFGDEEARIIVPAVEAARRAGLDVAGPSPADALLVDARDGAYDAVVAMYHDQGHIALKLLGRDRAVNITLGLPIVRTSVAHGTAFDVAWKRRADHRSMIEALQVAARLASLRQRR